MRGFVRDALTEPRAFGRDLKGDSVILEVRSGDGLVFLDLLEDEYSCEYGAEELILDRSSLEAAAGVTGVDQPRPLPEARWTRSVSTVIQRPTVRDVLGFGLALLMAALRFRGRTLRELADRAQGLWEKPMRHRMPPRIVADRFHQMLLWLPLRPKCLFESFFLLHFLALYGVRGDWIFGVQLFPFRAHCWIAADGELLNEVPHGIENYRIIWVVAAARP